MDSTSGGNSPIPPKRKDDPASVMQALAMAEAMYAHGDRMSALSGFSGLPKRPPKSSRTCARSNLPRRRPTWLRRIVCRPTGALTGREIRRRVRSAAARPVLAAARPSHPRPGVPPPPRPRRRPASDPGRHPRRRAIERAHLASGRTTPRRGLTLRPRAPNPLRRLSPNRRRRRAAESTSHAPTSGARMGPTRRPHACRCLRIAPART